MVVEDVLASDYRVEVGVEWELPRNYILANISPGEEWHSNFLRLQQFMHFKQGISN